MILKFYEKYHDIIREVKTVPRWEQGGNRWNVGHGARAGNVIEFLAIAEWRGHHFPDEALVTFKSVGKAFKTGQAFS